MKKKNKKVNLDIKKVKLRNTWGKVKPFTVIEPDKKKYNRKEKHNRKDDEN